MGLDLPIHALLQYNSPMRILHFSDLHIGVENYGRVDPETGLSTRLTDFLATLDEVVEYALGEGVDLVLFAGDAYKGRDPSQTHQRELAKRLTRLSAAGVAVFLLVGNHDLPMAVSRATAVEIYDVLQVPNVVVGDQPQSYMVETRAGPIQIAALPWPRRSRMLSREDSRGLSIDEITKKIEELCTEAVELMAERLDPNLPAVLAGHVTINGAKTGTEQNMMLGRDHMLFPGAVHRPEFDYVALGHIHRHQILREGPMVVYSGSLQRVDFTEEEDTKGFCVVELDPSQPRGRRLRDFRFQPVSARRFLTIDSHVPLGDEDPTGRVVGEIMRHDVAEAVVRLRIKVPAELEGLLRDGQIRQALGDAHYVAAITHEVERERRTRIAPGVAEGLAPMEALGLYLDSRNTSPARRETMLQYARELVEGDGQGEEG